MLSIREQLIEVRENVFKAAQAEHEKQLKAIGSEIVEEIIVPAFEMLASKMLYEMHYIICYVCKNGKVVKATYADIVFKNDDVLHDYDEEHIAAAARVADEYEIDTCIVPENEDGETEYIFYINLNNNEHLFLGRIN